MRTPRGWSGDELIKRLGHLGYVPTRQSGSHVRLTRADDGGDHHLTVPLHDPVRIGTLNAILRDVAARLDLTREEVLDQMR